MASTVPSDFTTASGPVASGYARYVGRVGALAVALGVGAAVVSMPAAFADTTGSAGSAGNTESSSSSSTSSAGKATGGSRTTRGNRPGGRAETDADTSSRPAGTGGRTERDTGDSADAVRKSTVDSAWESDSAAVASVDVPAVSVPREGRIPARCRHSDPIHQPAKSAEEIATRNKGTTGSRPRARYLTSCSASPDASGPSTTRRSS